MPNRGSHKSRYFPDFSRALGSLLAALLALRCGSSQPRTEPDPPSPPAELSSIVVPVHASLAPLLPLIEAQVPRTLGSRGDYELDREGRFGVRYRIERDAISLNQQGLGLHATTRLRYAVEACHRTWNPVSRKYSLWPCVSCGFGEPMREAVIHLHTHLFWDPAWRLRSTTIASPAEFTNRCAITALNVDVTSWKVAPLVNSQLRDLARSLDDSTPKTTSIRTEAERIWTAIQAPVDVGSRSWLLVEPVGFAMGPISGSGTMLASSLILTANIRLVVGQPPAPAARPLPPLQSATTTAATGLRIPLTVEVSYEEASRLVSAEVAGHTYKISGHDLHVESARLVPENGRLSIEAAIDYRGGGMRDYRGTVHLEGRPVYDPATSSIAIAGLDYSLDSKRRNPFVRLADHLAHEGVRESLARNARFRVRAQLDSARHEVSAALNRSLAPGLVLHGSLDRLEPTSIVALPDRLSIAVLAIGNASLDVK
jgi:hypothetical protein